MPGRIGQGPIELLSYRAWDGGVSGAPSPPALAGGTLTTAWKDWGLITHSTGLLAILLSSRWFSLGSLPLGVLETVLDGALCRWVLLLL